MDYFTIILLAVVQGLTEFLPISSSGHLLVAAAVCRQFGRQLPTDIVAVSIVLHLGTLLSILVYFWHRVWRLMGQDRRVVPLLVAGTIPAVVIGLPIKLLASDALLNNVLVAGFMFPVTGAMLLWASRHMYSGEQEYRELTFRQVMLIGLFQAVAVLPGISRSGATISAGLAVGLKRDSAATFAFLLAIPAIAGAGVLEIAEMAKGVDTQVGVDVLLLGALISFLVGLAALWWLTHWIRSGKLALFAFWCIPLGAAVLAWQAWQLWG